MLVAFVLAAVVTKEDVGVINAVSVVLADTEPLTGVVVIRAIGVDWKYPSTAPFAAHDVHAVIRTR